MFTITSHQTNANKIDTTSPQTEWLFKKLASADVEKKKNSYTLLVGIHIVSASTMENRKEIL